MSGTGFLDSFTPKKGNFEPAQKDDNKKHLIQKEASKQVEKVIEETKEKVEEIAMETAIKHRTLESSLDKVNPVIARMVQSARKPAIQHPFVMCGIAGHPKTGKTGIVLDSLTPEEIEAGAEIWHIDFDLGGETTKAAHHTDKQENLVILNPWVFNYGESRIPYDFPATFQQTIDILKVAKAQMDSQTEYLETHGVLPKPYLKTVVFDGADHWLHITETCMKVDDLELGVDGIAVAGKATSTKIGRFNWNIRATRYQTAMVALRELCRGGIHCYIITHMKAAFDGTGNELVGQDKPKWLKDTEGHLQQVIHTELEEERNENGELTGIVRGYAVVVANRTSLKSAGRVLLFERNPEGGIWYGWPSIAAGDFDTISEGGDE